MRLLLLSVLALAVLACCVSSPICNKPYIVMGHDCCLDRDDNMICDSDEVSSTTTSTSTTSTSTSSTTISSTTVSSTSTMRRTTTTSSTTSSTTTTTTTTSSTSSTTQKPLPVTKAAYTAHVMGSEEYKDLESRYDEEDILLAVGNRSYKDVMTILKDFEEEHNLDECRKCIVYGGGLIWICEFGSKDTVYMSAMDEETGKGALYRIVRKTDEASCRCDEI